MTLTIRPAAPSDADTVVRLLNEATEWIVARGYRPWNWRPWTAEDALSAIGRGETHLALEDGNAIATLKLQLRDETMWPARPADALYVHGLADARSAHGRNVGGLLLEFGARTAGHAGKRFLRLDCWCDNPPLRAHYVSHGFAWLGDKADGDGQHPYCASLFEKALL